MKSLRMELKRAIINKRLIMILIVGLILLFQPELYLRAQYTSLFQMDLLNAMQCSLGLGSFVLVSTALCVVPYADSYAWESKSRMSEYINSRQKTSSYVVSKLLAVGASGGITLSLCFGLFCIIQVIFSSNPSGMQDELSSVGLEMWLFFMYGFSWAIFALGFSAWINSPLVTLASAICVERGTQLISVTFNLPWLRLSNAIAFQCGSIYQVKEIHLVNFIIFICGAILFVLGVKKKKC